MHSEELDREWSAWVESRKRAIPPDIKFTERVMEAIRTESIRDSRKRPAPFMGGVWGQVWDFISGPGPMWQTRRSALAFVTVVMASLLLLQFFTRPFSSGSEGTRIKGSNFKMDYLLKRGNEIVPISSLDHFKPGDRLQAVYSSERNGFIQFFSVNALGRIQCLSCAGGDFMSSAGSGKTLPFALELDTETADEGLVAIWTLDTMNPAILEEWIHKAFNQSSRKLSNMDSTLSHFCPSGTRFSFFLVQRNANP